MPDWVAPVLVSSLLSLAFGSLGTTVIFMSKYSARLAELAMKMDGMIKVCSERHSGLDRTCIMETQTITNLAERVTHLERTRREIFKEKSE